MKTHDLISVLAGDARPVDSRPARRRLALGAVAGIVLALLLMAWQLGPRPDLALAVHWPMFWVKLGLPAAVLAAAWAWLLREGHPGARTGAARLLAAVPLAAMTVAGLLVLLAAPGPERPGLLFGLTWRDCLVNIPLLSLPALLLSLAALRGLAPTRLRLAGAAAGLFAGGAAAFAYALHCPELAAPFLGAWYVAGMLVPAVLGAVVGPRVLRW